MEKRPALKKLRNRCISCAYLYVVVFVGKVSRDVQEILDEERCAILYKDLPEGYSPPELRCSKHWVLPEPEMETVREAICQADDWKAHEDNVHPVTVEKREKKRKERADMWRWIIGIFLTLAILGLTIYGVFFQNSSP